MRNIFETSGGTALSSEYICEQLHAMEDRPWAEWGRSPRPITKNALARQLSHHKVRPHLISPDAGTQLGQSIRGYKIEDFKGVFASYLPLQSVEVLERKDTAGYGTNQSVVKDGSITLGNGSKPAGFNFAYESTSGWKGGFGWYTVPEGEGWITKTWKISDPQFVGKWGYHFSFWSDSTQHSQYSILSVTVTKE